MMRREELIANCQHYTGTLYLHGEEVSLAQLVAFAFDEGYMTGTHFHQFMDTVEASYKQFADAVIAAQHFEGQEKCR